MKIGTHIKDSPGFGDCEVTDIYTSETTGRTVYEVKTTDDDIYYGSIEELTGD